MDVYVYMYIYLYTYMSDSGKGGFLFATDAGNVINQGFMNSELALTGERYWISRSKFRMSNKITPSCSIIFHHFLLISQPATFLITERQSIHWNLLVKGRCFFDSSQLKEETLCGIARICNVYTKRNMFKASKCDRTINQVCYIAWGSKTNYCTIKLGLFNDQE